MTMIHKIRALGHLVIVLYTLSPVIFRYSPLIQRSLLFMNHVNTQYGFNLSQPEGLGIKCARTLRLLNDLQPAGDVNEPIYLGAWHILPESSLSSCVTSHDDNRTSIDDQLAFSVDNRPIVLYIHGNGGNRAGNHRGQLYRRLAREFDYHIVTFDYRGYGDSTNLQPTTGGLSADAHFMYRWLLKQPNVTKERVIVWGHSLGTAVSVRMVSELPASHGPKRLILESPFDSLANAIANHPFSTPFKILPYFEYFFVEPIENSPDLNFDSARCIGEISATPIMILHAEDDGIIPFKLGQNLYEKAAKRLGDDRVKFVTIGASHGLGHKHICKHDETMTLVKQFINDN